MLKAQVISAVSTAKTALQDLAVLAVLTSRGTVQHVPGLSPAYDSEQSFDVKVVLSKHPFKEIDGQRILSSDMQAISFPEAGKPDPKPNDVLTVDGIKWRVIANDPVMVGNSVALSITQLRRA